MNKRLLALLALAPLTLTSCGNLFKGLSTPEGDEQLLVAARGCMDRGDYNCALEYYQALSSSYGDVKVNETSLAKLANANVFKMSDLIGALGSARGDATSFVTMANQLASRGAANASNRAIIQTTYTDNNNIINSKLRAFSKFLSALSMTNAILAEIAGSDNLLTASDLVRDPIVCKSRADCIAISGNECSVPIASSSAPLNDPAGEVSDGGGSFPDALSNPSNWNGVASITKFIRATDASDSQVATFTGSTSNSGIFKALADLSAISGAEPCVRYTLVKTLGL
jgi:hypothetical protein